MDQRLFSSSKPGGLVEIASGGFAFIPHHLPPDIRWTTGLVNAYGAARDALGKLDAALPARDMNPYLVAYPLLLREAYYSSQMEGTYTTPKDMALFEVEKETSDPETREVMNYVRSMEHGEEAIRRAGRDVTQSLIRQLHEVLLAGTRGDDKSLGQYRKRQNYIGRPADGTAKARFVPPPPERVEGLMADLEEYLRHVEQSQDSLPLLVDLALIHYQFEAIHPFSDGNGRIGRLLIPLILMWKERIRSPLLYVSAYLDKNKEEYQDRLFRVSTRCEWNEWVSFFLKAIQHSAEESMAKVEKLWALRQHYCEKVQAPRASALLLNLIDELLKRPVITIARAQEILKTSQPTARLHVRRLEKLEIVKEITGGARNLRFMAHEVMSVAFD